MTRFVQSARTPLREILYVCQCGAEDRGKFYPGEEAPPCLPCWSCKSGQGNSIQVNATAQLGMWPVDPEAA